MFHLIRAGATYEIWSVRPLAENSVYAMKWLPPGERYTRAAVAALRHEYIVGKTLDHPNIIRIHEFGTCKDGAYLTMEIYRFPNLKQRIHLGAAKLHYYLPQLIGQMIASLAHLHEKGWVHRDVKPDNFLVDDDYNVRLIDFNLAQRQQGKLARLLSVRGKVQGTQSYISPEQIRGQVADYRSDYYSLGCVIYEMVHGKPPFTGTSSNELLNKHLRSKPPSLTVINKDIDPQFAQFVQQMMAKAPEERPESLAQWSQDLKLHQIFRNPPRLPVEADEVSEE